MGNAPSRSAAGTRKPAAAGILLLFLAGILFSALPATAAKVVRENKPDIEGVGGKGGKDPQTTYDRNRRKVEPPPVGGDLVMVIDLQKAAEKDGTEGVGMPATVAYSPDGKYIAVGGHWKTVRIFDAASGELYSWGPQPHLPIYWHLCLAWTPDSQRLFSGGGDHVIWGWSAATKFQKCERGLRPVPVWTLSVSMHPSGRLLASGGKDGTLNIWDIIAPPERGAGAGVGDRTSGPPIRQSQVGRGGEGMVNAVVWSPDGKYILTGNGDGMALWDGIGTGAGLSEPDEPAGKGGKRGKGGKGGGVKNNIPLVRRLMDASGSTQVLALDWSRDGKWAASAEGGIRGAVGSGSTAVRVWDTSSWSPKVIGNYPPRAYAASFSPDGTMIACGGGKRVDVFSTGSWAKVKTFSGNFFRDEVNCLSWSPDSSRVAVGAGGEKIDKDAEGADPFVYVFQVKGEGAPVLPPPTLIASKDPPKPPDPAKPSPPPVPNPSDPPKWSPPPDLSTPPLPPPTSITPANPPPIAPANPPPIAPANPPPVAPPPPPEPPKTSGPAALIAEAESLERASKWAEARDAYDQIVRLYPNSPESGRAGEAIGRLWKEHGADLLKGMMK